MRLAQWLEEQGLSQEAFGRRIGVSVATVNRISRGTQNSPIDLVEAIARETSGAVTFEDLAAVRREASEAAA